MARRASDPQRPAWQTKAGKLFPDPPGLSDLSVRSRGRKLFLGVFSRLLRLSCGHSNPTSQFDQGNQLARSFPTLNSYDRTPNAACCGKQKMRLSTQTLQRG